MESCYCCLVAKLCLTLCDPVDCSPLGSSVRFPKPQYQSGLLFPSPGDLPHPGIKPVSPAFAGRFFTTESPRKPFWSISIPSTPLLNTDRFEPDAFSPTKYILGISILQLIVTYCVLFKGCAIFVMWVCHILFIQNTMDGQLVAQSCLTLWDPLDCSPPGSSAHGILQARFWNGMPSPSQPKDRTWVSHIAGRFIWASYYLLRTLKRTFLAMYLAYLGSLSVYSLKKCWLRGYEKYFRFW